MDTHRGHNMELTDNCWIYCDNKKLVSSDKDRDCGKCGQPNTKEGHDPCLGALKYAMNACCGHGEIREAYIQFSNRFLLKGLLAVIFINIFKDRN